MSKSTQHNPKRHKFTKKQKRTIAEHISRALDEQFTERGGRRRLAEIVGVTPAAISHWRKGVRTPAIHHLIRLSIALDILVHALCGLPDNQRIRDDGSFFGIVMNMSLLGARLMREGEMTPPAKEKLTRIAKFLCATRADSGRPRDLH